MTHHGDIGRAVGFALIALATAAVLQAAAPGSGAGAVVPPRATAAAGPGEARPPAHDRRPRPTRLASLVPPGRPAVRVPILMYHYIRGNPDPNDRLGFDLSVTPADFAAQMDWLAAGGYHPVDLDDLRGYLLSGRELPERPVVLTFDDGYRDLYTAAYPVLRAHGFKAVAYIVSGFVGSPVSVTAEQVLEMDANGIQIGAHSVSHADLTRLSGPDLWHEVHDSKVALEALLGHPVLDFCYPSGRVDQRVLDAVGAAGFQSATTTQPGQVHQASDRFLWTRVRVHGGEPLAQLAAEVGPPEAGVPVATPVPAARQLHGATWRPVTTPLLPPPRALRAAAPTEGALP